MKNLNLLKLFILLTTVISSFSVSAQSQQRTANIVNETSAPYYAVYSNASEKIDISNESSNNLEITLGYPCNNVDFNITTTRFIFWGTAKIAIDATKSGNWDDTEKIHETDYSGNSKSGSQSFNTTEYSKIAFKCTGGGNSDEYVHDVKFTIAPHLILSTKALNFGEVEFNGGNKNMNIEFHSFYNANDELKITNNTNPDVFRITTTKIADKGKLKKVNTSDYAVQVSFYPNTTGEHSATITISDGQFTETVTLTGVGTKKAQKITWKDTKQICIGETLENPASALYDANITYESSNPEIIAVEGNVLRPIAEGKATITATVAESDTYFGATATKEFESTSKTLQTITWNQDFYNLRLGGNQITLDATASSGLNITYTSDNENVVKIEDNTLTIVGEGTTYIHATQAGDETYAATNESKYVYVRNSNACANYALSAPDKVSKSGAFNWDAITVTHNLTAPGDKLSFSATCSAASTGQVLRVYDELGNNYVNESSVKSFSDIQIDKKAQTLTFVLEANLDRSISEIFVTQATYLEATKENVVFAAAEIGSTASTSIGISYSNFNDIITIALKNGSNFSVDKNYIDCQCGQFGTEEINVTLNAKEIGTILDTLVVTCGNYSFETPIVAEIIKHYQSITWSQDLLALNPTQGNTYALEATASSELPISYTSSDENIARIDNNNLIVVGAGEVTIIAHQDGDVNYEPATPVSKTITIAKLDQTITWEQEFAADLTIGNTVELNATATSGDAVVFASSNEAVATIADNVLTVTGIGETTITASQAGNNNYNAATEVTKTLSIGKLDQTITWNQDIANLQIGESVTLDATASSGLEIVYTSNNDSVASIDGTTLTVNSEGSVVITATQAGDETYKSASFERTFSFGRMAQTITWNDDLTNLVINDTVILTATSDAELAIVYTVDNNTVATINGDTLFIIGAGEAIITASQAGNETYNSTSVSKTINIAKLDQTITWEQEFAADLTIGNTIELNATATSGEAVVFASSNEAVATIADNVLTVTGVGETTITASQAGNNNYNAATEVTKTLSIGKLDQTITWNQDIANLQIGESVTLDATASSGLEIVYTSNNDSVASIDGTTLTVNSEGSVVITATQAGDETYKSASFERTFSFGRMAQTITWNDDLTNLVINDTVILTATSDAELAIVYTVDNNTVATINGDTLFIIGAGEAIITASQAGNETYNSTSVSKTINIAKLGQAIEWNQELDSLTIENEAIELTATATSGLSITYTSSDETVAVVNGNILTIVGVGSATITASQEGDNTYNEAESVEKTITITKQTQEIIWEQTFEDLDIEDYPYELTAYATSGLEIIYELDNDSEGEKAMIEGNYLYPFQGNCYITIYAYQEGNEMYEAAKYVEKTVYISSSKLNPTHIENTTTTLIYVDNTIYFNGKHNTLSVYDMTGRQIYSAKVTGENQHYLPLTQCGIYVVCLDNETLKIVK